MWDLFLIYVTFLANGPKAWALINRKYFFLVINQSLSFNYFTHFEIQTHNIEINLTKLERIKTKVWIIKETSC